MKFTIALNMIIFIIVSKKKTDLIINIKPIIITNPIIKIYLIIINLIIRTNQKKWVNLVKSNIINIFYSIDKKYYVTILVLLALYEKSKKTVFIFTFIYCIWIILQ